MPEALIPIGLIILLWVICAVLRQVGFLSDTQFLVITVVIILILLWLGRVAYLTYAK